MKLFLICFIYTNGFNLFSFGLQKGDILASLFGLTISFCSIILHEYWFETKKKTKL